MLLNKKLVILIGFFFCAVNYARPLRILFIVGHFPSPSQIFILNIMTGLIDKGHDVSIFSFNKDTHKNMHPHIKKYKLLDRVTYGQFPFRLPDCDIVFCQFGNLGKKIFTMKQLARWLKTRKVVVCFRGSDITTYVKDNPNIYKKLFRKSDLFLPVCDYFKTRLTALGCNPDKIVVHHSAIDCSQFFFKARHLPTDGTIHLISVCRLVKKKGIDYAIKAIARVAQRYPHIHFTIVGDGPEKNYLQSLIDKLNLHDVVSLRGWQTQKVVVDLLSRSHIFLLPSLTSSDGNEEGIPNAIKEAMAMGLISIATWHAGTPELIDDGISGFLVPEKNIYKLKKAIEYVIEHPEIWESVGLAGRKKVEDEFETKQSIEKLEKIFYRLLS